MTAMTAMPVSRRRRLGVAATALATGVVAAASVAHTTRAPRVTSYAAASDPAALLGLAAAVALLMAGGLAVFVARGPVGGLCLLMSAVWVAPVFVGWEAGAPALRASAAMAPSLAVPVLFHLAVTGQRAPSTSLRATVATGYLVLGGLGVVAGVVHNPFLDLDSWSNVSDFVFLEADAGVAGALRRWLLVSTVVAGVVAGIVIVVRAVRLGSWRGGSMWGPALAALMSEAGYAAFLLRQPLEQFTSGTGAALFVVRAASLVALGAAVAWRVDARRRLLHRMTGLAAELGQRPRPGVRGVDACGTAGRRPRGPVLDARTR